MLLKMINQFNVISYKLMIFYRPDRTNRAYWSYRAHWPRRAHGANGANWTDRSFRSHRTNRAYWTTGSTRANRTNRVGGTNRAYRFVFYCDLSECLIFLMLLYT
jgi:hypothetical protein